MYYCRFIFCFVKIRYLIYNNLHTAVHITSSTGDDFFSFIPFLFLICFGEPLGLVMETERAVAQLVLGNLDVESSDPSSVIP